jgi:hypothetical protein
MALLPPSPLASQFDQAKEDYKRALAIEPHNEKLQHDYAMLSTPL